MNVSIQGLLEVSAFSHGWVLEAEDGSRYPLKGPVPDTLQAGDPVVVRGRLRPDLASIDMTGPVLEVQHIEKRTDRGGRHAAQKLA